jgi:hypothetical protein
VKQRAIKIENKKRYLSNYQRYFDKLMQDLEANWCCCVYGLRNTLRVNVIDLKEIYLYFG